MKLLRKYIRGLLTENMCPIRGAYYGGIPAGGGFQSHKEYTVAAQRYFEAAHCILGSLGKRIGAEGETEWHSMVAGEREHLTEEIGIMLSVVDEYDKDLYVQQLNDLSQYREEYHDEIREYNEGAVADIKKKSPKLIALAQDRLSMLENVIKNEPEFPRSVYNVGRLTYEAIIVAAQALLVSVQNWDQTKRIEPRDNAWRRPGVKGITKELNSAIQNMFQDLG